MSSIYNFPNQRVSEKEKDEEWHKQHIVGYLTYTTSNEFSHKKKEISDLYYAYSAQLTKEGDAKVRALITERCGANFGPQYFVYPLIESKIEQVCGEYRQRPLKRKCLVNNEKAVIKKLDAKIDMLTEKLMRDLTEEVKPILGMAPETEKPEMKIPEDIVEFFSKDYRTISEEIGEDILYQILLVRKEKEKIYEALKHYLISGRVHAFIDEKDGHPSIFIPHVLDCFYDINPNDSLQNDLQYFCFDKFMSINDIFNTFDGISEKDKRKIESYAKVGPGAADSTSISWFRNDGGVMRPRVVSMLWKSRIKKKFKVITNAKTGKEEYKILGDDYKVRNRDDVKTIEIDDVRHITMVGPDVILSFGSQEKQMQTVGNPKKRFIPVVGLIDENAIGTGEIRSLAKKLLYLQDFASEILYEIRLNMRQLDGNVMVYDLANIPKEWMALGADKALEKVNFFLKRDRIQLINSKDKRSNPYASSVNVSQKGRTSELMQLLALIEDLADRISGVKHSAENPYQKATVAELSANTSSTRVEEYFGIFDTFVEIIEERIILKGKHVYEENQVFSYFGGDAQMKFLQIFPDFFVDDLGIYIGDNRKEYERKKRIDEMAGQTFGNAQSPELIRDLLRIWNADSSTEAEAILNKGIKALEKVREENNQMQQQMAEQQQKADEAKRQEEAQLKREGYAKDIKVAEIYANNKADDTGIKEQNANLREMAKIEKDLVIANKNQQNKKEK